MQHEANQARQGLGMIGGQTPKPVTLNDRLNTAADRLSAITSRMQMGLNRIHGVQPTPAEGINKISQTRPMVASVSDIEEHIQRLHQLAESLDQVA